MDGWIKRTFDVNFEVKVELSSFKHRILFQLKLVKVNLLGQKNRTLLNSH